MKLLLISILCLFANCSAATQTANMPDTPVSSDDEILATVTVMPDGKNFDVRVVFFTDISEKVDGKTIRGFGKNIREVTDPKFNDQILSGRQDEYKHTTYSIDLAKLPTKNAITFTFEGKDYVSRTEVELTADGMSKTIEFTRVVKEKKN